MLVRIMDSQLGCMGRALLHKCSTPLKNQPIDGNEKTTRSPPLRKLGRESSDMFRDYVPSHAPITAGYLGNTSRSQGGSPTRHVLSLLCAFTYVSKKDNTAARSIAPLLQVREPSYKCVKYNFLSFPDSARLRSHPRSPLIIRVNLAYLRKSTTIARVSYLLVCPSTRREDNHVP